jgi:putative tryptophan/tyrosine transport system substrate-binding protein
MVRHNNSIPVVFSSITDPVSAGIVPKDSAPGMKTGTNMTGVSDKWPVALQMKMYAEHAAHSQTLGNHLQPGRMNSVTHIKGCAMPPKAWPDTD